MMSWATSRLETRVSIDCFFDVAVGLGFRHVETLDEQPLGPVHQTNLFHALFHRLLFGLQLAQPLPQGTKYPREWVIMGREVGLDRVSTP